MHPGLEANTCMSSISSFEQGSNSVTQRPPRRGSLSSGSSISARSEDTQIWVPSKLAANTLASSTAVPRLLQTLQSPPSGSPSLHASASPSPSRKARAASQAQPQAQAPAPKQTPLPASTSAAGVRRPSPPELHPLSTLSTFEGARARTPTPTLTLTANPPRPPMRTSSTRLVSNDEGSIQKLMNADADSGSKMKLEAAGSGVRRASGASDPPATMETDLDAPLDSPKHSSAAQVSSRPPPVEFGTRTMQVVKTRPELQPRPLRLPLDAGSVFGDLDMPLDVPPMSPMSPIPSVSANPSPVLMLTSSIDDYRPSPAHCQALSQELTHQLHKEVPAMSLLQCGGDDLERGLLQQATSRLNGRLISLLSCVPDFGGAGGSSSGSALQVGLQSPSGSGSASGSGISSNTASATGRGHDSTNMGMGVSVGIGIGIVSGPGSGSGGGEGGGSAGGGSSCTGSNNTCHSGSVLNNGSGGGSRHHQSVHSVALSNNSSSNLSTGQQPPSLGLNGGTGTILPMPNYGARDLPEEQHLLPAIFQQRICGPAGATADMGLGGGPLSLACGSSHATVAAALRSSSSLRRTPSSCRSCGGNGPCYADMSSVCSGPCPQSLGLGCAPLYTAGGGPNPFLMHPSPAVARSPAIHPQMPHCTPVVSLPLSSVASPPTAASLALPMSLSGANAAANTAHLSTSAVISVSSESSSELHSPTITNSQAYVSSRSSKLGVGCVSRSLDRIASATQHQSECGVAFCMRTRSGSAANAGAGGGLSLCSGGFSATLSPTSLNLLEPLEQLGHSASAKCGLLRALSILYGGALASFAVALLVTHSPASFAITVLICGILASGMAAMVGNLAIQCGGARGHQFPEHTASSSGSKRALHRRRPQTPHHSRVARSGSPQRHCSSGALYSFCFCSEPSAWLRMCLLLLGLVALALLALDLVAALARVGSGRGGALALTPDTVVLVIINNGTITTPEGATALTIAAGSEQSSRTTAPLLSTSTVPSPPHLAAHAALSSLVNKHPIRPAAEETTLVAILIVDVFELAFVLLQLYYICSSNHVSQDCVWMDLGVGAASSLPCKSAAPARRRWAMRALQSLAPVHLAAANLCCLLRRSALVISLLLPLHKWSSALLVDAVAPASTFAGKSGGRSMSHASFLEELLVESAPYTWHASALYHLLCVVLSLHAWRELWSEASAAPDARAVMERRTEEEEDVMVATVYRNPAPTPVSMRSHAMLEHAQHLNQLSAATPTTQSPMTALSQAACSDEQMVASVKFGTCPGRVARSRSAGGQGAGPNALVPGMAATLGLGPDSSDTDSESSSDELAGPLFQVNTTSALQPAFTISGSTSADARGSGNRYRLALDLLLGLLAVALIALHVSLFQLLANRESIYVALLESLFFEGALHIVSCAALLVILVYTQSHRHSRSKDAAFAEDQRATKRGKAAAVSGLHQGLVYVAAIGLFLLAFLNVFAVRAELDTLTTALNTLNALLLCAHCSLTVLFLMLTSPLNTNDYAGASRSMAVGTRALALVLASHLLVDVGSALPRAILLFGGCQASAFASTSATSSQIAPAMAIALTPIGSLFHALAALHLSGLFPHAKRV